MSIIDDANHNSFLTRQKAVTQFAELDAAKQRELFVALLKSPYKDVREGVFEVLDEDTLNRDPAWLEEITLITDSDPKREALLCIGLFVLLARFRNPLPAKIVTFGERCLEADDVDLRYQAASFLESQEVSTTTYVEKLKSLLTESDEDLRILAIQGIVRNKPFWAVPTLLEQRKKARGMVGFHLLLALFELGDQTLRNELEPHLALKLSSDRFCYPAIVMLKKYGTQTSVEPLMLVATALLGDSTIRIAAAEAAATIGCEKAIDLLEKFAKHSGNKEYAQLALDNIRKNKK